MLRELLRAKEIQLAGAVRSTRVISPRYGFLRGALEQWRRSGLAYTAYLGCALLPRLPSAGLPVHATRDVNDAQGRAFIERLAPELLVTAFFNQRVGAWARGVNLHPSLLPALRGTDPVFRALARGERRLGVTLHRLAPELDAGDIVAQRAWRIGPRDTARELFFRAVEETKILLREVWPAIRSGTAPRIPQDERSATYRGRRRPEDGRIDWNVASRRIDGLVRAVTDPFPGAFTFLGGRKLMIWEGRPADGRGTPGVLIDDSLVATADGAYRIERCAFEDDPSASPLLSRGSRFGESV